MQDVWLVELVYLRTNGSLETKTVEHVARSLVNAEYWLQAYANRYAGNEPSYWAVYRMGLDVDWGQRPSPETHFYRLDGTPGSAYDVVTPLGSGV